MAFCLLDGMIMPMRHRNGVVAASGRPTEWARREAVASLVPRDMADGEAARVTRAAAPREKGLIPCGRARSGRR